MTLQLCTRHQRFPASIPNGFRSGRGGEAEFLGDSCLRRTQLARLREPNSARRLNLTTGVTHGGAGAESGEDSRETAEAF